MIASLLAAATAAATVWAAPVETPAVRQGILREVPARCLEGRVMAVRGDDSVVRKLGDLPKAHLMLPVVRTVDGCAAPTFVRYNVEGDGRAARGR
jgi:hypothetical protein